MSSARAAELPLVSRTALRNAVIASVAMLAAIGALLLARRVDGAFNAPLDFLTFAVTLLLAAAIVIGGRVAWRQLVFDQTHRYQQAIAWAGTAAVWLLWLGCAPPNLRSFSWLMGLPVVAADHVSRRRFLNRPSAPCIDEVATSGIPPLAPPFAGGESQERIVQQLTRARDVDGVERVHGTLHADFAAGQRHSTLHVGFCPPLERVPDVEVEVADGPEATVKLTQAFAHGAQLELRLAEPAEEACEVAIEFCATPAQVQPG